MACIEHRPIIIPPSVSPLPQAAAVAALHKIHGLAAVVVWLAEEGGHLFSSLTSSLDAIKLSSMVYHV